MIFTQFTMGKYANAHENAYTTNRLDATSLQCNKGIFSACFVRFVTQASQGGFDEVSVR